MTNRFEERAEIDPASDTKKEMVYKTSNWMSDTYERIRLLCPQNQRKYELMGHFRNGFNREQVR